MFNDILNYGIRIIIIVLGILIFFDFFNIAHGDTKMIHAVGVIMILFGVYRIISYYSASKRYKNFRNRDEDDNNLE